MATSFSSTSGLNKVTDLQEWWSRSPNRKKFSEYIDDLHTAVNTAEDDIDTAETNITTLTSHQTANGRISANFATIIESDGTNMVGYLGPLTTPVLDLASGDTDSNLDMLWASSNSDAILITFDLPPEIDTASDITFSASGLMSGTTDTPTLALDSYFDTGDTKVEDTTTAFSDSQATVTATIAAADIPAGAKKLTIEVTPGAHTTDTLTINEIWITFGRVQIS